MVSSTMLKSPSRISGYGNRFVLKASRSCLQKFLLSEGALGVYMFKIVSMRSACQGMETRRACPGIISCIIVPLIYYRRDKPYNNNYNKRRGR